MSSKGERQSKISVKENGVVFLDSTDNSYTVCRFLSNFYDTSPRKLPHPKNEFPRPKKESKPLRSFIIRLEMNVKF